MFLEFCKCFEFKLRMRVYVPLLVVCTLSVVALGAVSSIFITVLHFYCMPCSETDDCPSYCSQTGSRSTCDVIYMAFTHDCFLLARK